jgi:hypothetical protein
MNSLYDNLLLPTDKVEAKIALVFICTGVGYCTTFLQSAIDGAKKFFPSDILLFTDSLVEYDVARQVYLKHQGWPAVTLYRYHTMLIEKNWLSQYEYIFHFDVDMKLVQSITDEILSDGITVTMHPDFVNGGGATDMNPASTAYLPCDQIRQYVTGAFQGGTSQEFLKMATKISWNIDIDSTHGVTARVLDESHLNRYVYDNPPAKILSTDYCCKYHKGTTAYIECMDETDSIKEIFRHQ